MTAQNISLLTLSVKATGTIAANRFVTYAGAQAGAGANAMGLSRAAAVANDTLAVDVIGTGKATAGAAVAAGALVESDSTGRAITRDEGAILGRALEAATAANQVIEVLLIQN